VSISVNCWPLSAKLASFMTRPIVDWFSELVFYKSQIGPGRKSRTKCLRGPDLARDPSIETLV